MRRFFISADHIDTNEGVAILGESDARHISRVLRMVPGGKIIVCDMNGNEYEGMLGIVNIGSVQK
jgi:16S rRNA U1498 N3-methylase RsmE